MKNRILHWFWSTWIGGKYLELLLWIEDQNESKPEIHIREVKQIVIQAQQLLYTEGLRNIKKKVNAVVNAKSKEEYDARLREIEDLMPLAHGDDDKMRELKAMLQSANVRKGKDIKSATDHAKMIDSRIGDYKELREHKEKRRLLKDIRTHRKLGNEAVASKLEQEFNNKYVRRN